MADQLWEVELDGAPSDDNPADESERSGTLTVHASSEAAAKAFAEAQNPGLVAVGARKLTTK